MADLQESIARGASSCFDLPVKHKSTAIFVNSFAIFFLIILYGTLKISSLSIPVILYA